MLSSLGRVCLPAAVIPSMSGSCPAATWMPTPARNPTSTVRDRKFARKPSRASRATSSIPPASRAASPASRTYRSDPAAARPVSAAASMAAVAESAATTRWRDEPRTAKTAIGRSIVYKPVTSGIPAIFAYPSTSGIPRAASVRPASMSMGTRDRSMGSTPCRTGWARSHPRQRSAGEPGIVSPPPRLRRSSGLVHHLATGRSPALDDVPRAPQNDRLKRSLVGSQHCPHLRRPGRFRGRCDRTGAGRGRNAVDVRRAGRRSQPGRGRGGGDGRAALHPDPRRDRRGHHGRHLRRPHRHARSRGRHPGAGAGQRGQRHRPRGPGPAARGGHRGYGRGRRRQPGQSPADRPGGVGPVGRQGGDHRRPAETRRGGRADRPDGASGAARARASPTWTTARSKAAPRRQRARRQPLSKAARARRRQRAPKAAARRPPPGTPRMPRSWPEPCGGRGARCCCWARAPSRGPPPSGRPWRAAASRRCTPTGLAASSRTPPPRRPDWSPGARWSGRCSAPPISSSGSAWTRPRWSRPRGTTPRGPSWSPGPRPARRVRPARPGQATSRTAATSPARPR